MGSAKLFGTCESHQGIRSKRISAIRYASYVGERSSNKDPEVSSNSTEQRPGESDVAANEGEVSSFGNRGPWK